MTILAKQAKQNRGETTKVWYFWKNGVFFTIFLMLVSILPFVKTNKALNYTGQSCCIVCASAWQQYRIFSLPLKIPKKQRKENPQQTRLFNKIS